MSSLPDGLQNPELERRQRVESAYAKLATATHYELLGVAPAASKEEIRRAYFELSRVFHPDTAYGEDLGSLQGKMEAVFQVLTQAYRTLGEEQARRQYDLYVSVRARMQAATEVLRQRSPFDSAAPPAAEGRARRLAATRLLAASGRRLADGDAAAKVETWRRRAQVAAEAGDDVAAVSALGKAYALAPDRSELAEEYGKARQALAGALAEPYAEQAQYESDQQQWHAASLSWANVCEGRPQDGVAAGAAARAFLAAGVDLQRAHSFAQRAVRLRSDDVEARCLLVRVLMALGQRAEAEQELREAARLSPLAAAVRTLQHELLRE